MKIFIDDSAWVQLLDTNALHHQAVTDAFSRALQDDDKLFTHNIAIGIALSEIKRDLGFTVAWKFNEIIEEAYTGTHLTILWIGRRNQKEAMRLMRKHAELPLGLYDFASYILMKRRRISTILSLRSGYNQLELKVLPEINGG